MSKQIVVLTASDFEKAVEQTVHKILQKVLPPLSKNSSKDNVDEFLTRKQTAKFINVSFPTLDDYTSKGILIKYKIGSRVMYKKSEVIAAIKPAA